VARGFFMQNTGTLGMGIGALGNPSILIKRKFRWLLEIIDCEGNQIIPPTFVKVNARPKMNMEEEIEVSFVGGNCWIPGKMELSYITFTIFDIENNSNSELMNYLSKIWVEAGKKETIDIVLNLLDGCAQPIEAWKLSHAMITSVSWQDVDYSASELASLEITAQYKATEYKGFIGPNISPNLNPTGQTMAWSDFDSSHKWTMPETWKIHNPISTEYVSPGAKILDQFLQRTKVSK
jgi:hypothetical protein